MESFFCIITAAASAYALAVYISDANARVKLWRKISREQGDVGPLILKLAAWLDDYAEKFAFGIIKKYFSNGISRKFTAAGIEGSEFASGVAMLWGILCVACAISFALIFSSHPIFAFIVGAVFGWLFVNFSIKKRIKQRRNSIERDLPFALDMMTLSVEAGSDLISAISRVAERLKKGPLGYEFKRMSNAIHMGVPRCEAFKEMSRAVGVDSVSAIVALLVQADKLGTGVGPILRAASSRMRAIRFAAAERRGAVAAQKALLPLILCIMPAAFVVIFGPIALRLFTGGIDALL